MPESQLFSKNTALVLLDLQNGIVAMNAAPHPTTQVVEKSKKLADAFRNKGATVVYVRVDLNDFRNVIADQPQGMGDEPIPAVA